MLQRFERPVLVVAVAVFALASVLALGLERWFVRLSLYTERQHVRAALLPHANQLVAVLGRRISQIAALKTFVETVPGSARLERDFEPFAAGLLAAATGLRAVEVVRSGRIALVSPLAGNEPALAIVFLRHPNELLRQGYRRALETDDVTIIGPVRLAQGGNGLILFRRASAPYDRRVELVELVLDLPALLREVNLDRPAAGVAVQLLDRRGGVISSSVPAMTDDPVEVVVPGLDGRWVLRGAPVRGWSAAVASRVHPLRLALVTIVLLVTVVAVLLVDRTSRLARLVEVRTSSLAQLADDQRATIERFRDSQRALAASEARLRLSLAASSSATFEMDVETGAVDWSPEAAAIVGLVPAATIGDIAAFASHLESSDGQRVQLAFEQARSVASQATFELRTTVAADGSIRWVALHLISQADADGAIRRIVGTLTDITERRKLEEQFLHAQKMQAVGVLAGGVAHDFNNLLTVILGAGQMARAACDAADATESLRTDLDEVLLAGERAAILTGQLLAFSRRQVVQPTHFDIGALVRSTEPMLRRLVGEQIRTETRLPETPVPVFADQGQLTQVLMNLAVNAKDAMPAGGVLRIEVRTGGPPPGPARPDEVFAAKQYALLSVSDTGTGIDPLVQRRIFEPFFTTKPVGQGTGLGLPTVYGIARQFGGTVRFVTAPGEGSTFSVFIPMDETGASDASLGSVPPIAANGSGRTVLLVEDEAALRAMVARVLTDAAYEVLLAEDGVSALRQARERHGPIDLLVSDVTMPRLGGVELATVLSEERPRLRVLLMSGYPQREHNASAESLRGVSFIAKPFFPGELLMAVERALAAAD